LGRRLLQALAGLAVLAAVVVFAPGLGDVGSKPLCQCPRHVGTLG
jgi:hypothetical protein